MKNSQMERIHSIGSSKSVSLSTLLLLLLLVLFGASTDVVNAFAPPSMIPTHGISTNTHRIASLLHAVTPYAPPGTTSKPPPPPRAFEAPKVAHVASHIEARLLVETLQNMPRPDRPAKVIVMGGGLAGLSTAKHLVDAGLEPVVLEARNLLGGKVAAWKDADGHVSETGLHVFFGAYPNALALFDDLGIADRLQWKEHQMLFAKPGKPTREFATFDFPSFLPAPLNAGWAILSCTDLLTWPEKLLLGWGLLPAYMQGQSYVEAQEGVTVQAWMRARGIPDRVTDEVFLAMSKALGFIGPETLSMQCVLIALNRFLQETGGSRIAFLDGNPTERLCQPLKEYIEARGGQIVTDAAVQRILLNDDDTVAGLLLAGQQVVSADVYVNAMPVDALKTLTPDAWRDMPYFTKLRNLRGVPVMNCHVWLDRKLEAKIDNLIFSRSAILSVYADMSETCREYADPHKSMLELVLAPAAKYMTKTDAELQDICVAELAQLFPQEIGMAHGGGAQVEKFTCVRTPTSVYETVPGMDAFRPSQRSPVANFYSAGDFTKQKYLASMEGAILSGKLAATAVAQDWQLSRQHNERAGAAAAPRQLTPRPRNDKIAVPVTQDRTMYVTKRATGDLPQAVQQELEAPRSSQTTDKPLVATAVTTQS